MIIIIRFLNVISQSKSIYGFLVEEVRDYDDILNENAPNVLLASHQPSIHEKDDTLQETLKKLEKEGVSSICSTISITALVKIYSVMKETLGT